MAAAATALPLRAAPAPPRAGEVERERLTRRLLAAREPVIVLRAPAGYGKTTILMAWARADPRAFAWLRPGGAVTGARDRVHVLDGWPAPALGDPAGPAARLGPGSQLVIATRMAVPLGRLRAQHDVLELGPADLAMTHGEAARLMAASGAPVRGAALAAPLAVAEGWPALLSLAAQAIAAAPDPASAARRFGAGDQHVVDYILDEVVAPLPPRVARFARRAALLDGLDATRCDELLGGRDGAALLADACARGLPLARVQRAGPPRWRLHPLAAAVLRDDLRAREPDAEPALRRRASRLCEARGDVEAAIGHALAVHDVARAGGLLWQRGAAHAWEGRATDLARWLDALPPGAAERHATVALTIAMHATPRLALGRADRALAAADATLHHAPPELTGSLRAGADALRAFTSGTAGAGALRAAGARAAAGAADGEPARALAALLTGAGLLLGGDAASAVAPLEDGVRRAFVTAPAIAALCEAELALAALCDGDDQDEGLRRAERASARVTAHGLGDRAALALVAAVTALARAQAGRHDDARAGAEAAAALLAGRDAIPPWLGAQVALALGRALLALHDPAAARTRIAAARRLAARLPDAVALHDWCAQSAAALDALHAPGDLATLTPAELRVLRHLPSHLSCREIGALQHVSANTIKSQVHAIYRKLGVSSRSTAVTRATELGLL
jgi:LuxR family transcriptional regulator, maltose regulon positive regulatory protein